MSAPSMPNLKPIEQIMAPTKELDEIENEFRTNVTTLCENMNIKAEQIQTNLSKKGDQSMSFLGFCIKIIHNYLINLTHKSHLIKGYIFRVYVSKEYIDKRDYVNILDDDEYLYGDFAAAKGFAPLVKRLFTEFLTEEERENVRDFFRTFNTLAEDWLLEEGVEKILLQSERNIDKEDGDILLKIKNVICKLEEKQDDEKLLESLFVLLDDTREEFGRLRDERVANGTMYILAPPKPAAKQSTQKKAVDPKKDKEIREARKKKAKEILENSDSSIEEQKPVILPKKTVSDTNKQPNIYKSKEEAIRNDIKRIVNPQPKKEESSSLKPPIIIAKNDKKPPAVTKPTNLPPPSESSDDEDSSEEEKKPAPKKKIVTKQKQPTLVKKKAAPKKKETPPSSESE